jgi:hypothetical protein
VYLLFVDESGQIEQGGLFALGGIACAASSPTKVLPRFARHPATGELDGWASSASPSKSRASPRATGSSPRT